MHTKHCAMPEFDVVLSRLFDIPNVPTTDEFRNVLGMVIKSRSTLDPRQRPTGLGKLQ